MSAATDAIDVDFREADGTAGSTALAVQNAPLATRVDQPVHALVTPDEARKAWADYEALKAAIATPSDFQEFKDKKTNQIRRFPKKSFVKKIQTFFGVSVTTRDIVRDDLGDGHFGFRCIGIATATNGRTVESTGACSTFEDRFDIKRYDDESEARYLARKKAALARAYHDVLSTAETRATNRAVMNLIGGGEVTADEISREATPVRSRRETMPAAPVEQRQRVQTEMLMTLADQAGVGRANLGGWLATHVAPDLPERRRKILSDEESIRAAEMLRALATETAYAAGDEDDARERERDERDRGYDRATPPSAKQKGLLFALHSQLGHNDGDRHLTYKQVCGKESFSQLTSGDVARVIDVLAERSR